MWHNQQKVMWCNKHAKASKTLYKTFVPGPGHYSEITAEILAAVSNRAYQSTHTYEHHISLMKCENTQQVCWGQTYVPM